MKRAQWVGMGLLVVAVLALWAVLWRTVIDPPPSVVLTNARIVEKIVGAGSQVRMRVKVKTDDPPECLIASQHYLHFSDDSNLKLPAIRATEGDGYRATTYEAEVPPDAPLGIATFRVVETYGCGRVETVEAGPLPFEIR